MDELEKEPEEMVPRGYQTQLEEIAVRRNTIIHLPTGSGKTFIAIRIITRFRVDLKKPWGEGGKRTFFLVNTVPLVEQQKNCIQSFVDAVAGYSSEDKVDYWNKSKWDEELRNNEVLVMTSQILSDMLQHTYISIEDINLLVFDECHHAVDDHPMRSIMKHFENCPVSKQPRVLGLTATLLNANVTRGKIESTIKSLETTFHATVATVNELGEVLTYSTNPREFVHYYRPYTLTPAAVQAIGQLDTLLDVIGATKLPPSMGTPDVKLQRGQRDITRDPFKITKAVKNMVVDMITLINSLGVYGGSLGILAYIILLERLKRKALREEGLLYKVAITHSLLARGILEDSMKNSSGYEKIVRYSSEQFLLLLDVLKEYHPERIKNLDVLMNFNQSRQELCGIIFTKQRFTTKILYNLLKAVKDANPEEFGFLDHEFLVGFNLNPFKNTREDHYNKKSSQKALIKFSHNDLNCIISTSVIEEGVDIPKCSLVLRFDPPLEYRSYVQSKGRARSSKSSYVIFVKEEDRSKFQKQYQTFLETESFIQKMLVGHTDNRESPTDKEIQEMYEESIIPPYVNPNGDPEISAIIENSGRLLAVSGISLLNRYCSMLPHDQFTTISPLWLMDEENYNKIITILLPIACPIKDPIVGDPMPNVKEAKRSAALKACIVLHNAGELDAKTMLPKAYGKVDFNVDEVKACFPNWPWGKDSDDEGLPKAGGKKRMRKYNKQFPSYLEGIKNVGAKPAKFYLHVINLKANFDQPTDSRELVLYNFLKKHQGYAFLTPKPLPKLCSFPTFLTIGEATTTMEMNYATELLDKAHFDLVIKFHHFVFDQVLEVAKKFLVFEGVSNALYVVPVDVKNGQVRIDWEIMGQFDSIPPLETPSSDERRKLRVVPEEYKHAVVTPWYRNSGLPQRYVVSNVLEHLTPQSQFETEYFGTYVDYYQDRYLLDIQGSMDQPLLEVRNISTGMNCLLPRAASLPLTDKQRRQAALAQGDDHCKGFKETFVPEFCTKYAFPGNLWYKATALPGIVHRVTMLLVAYELRAQIARETRIGQPEPAKGNEWKPITLNMNLAIQSLLAQVDQPAEIQTTDRINNPIDEDAPRPFNIVSMRQSMYKLKKTALDKEYPWSEESEPLDIERNLSTVTMMDIECYDEFVTAPLAAPPAPAPARAPARTPAPAILPPPLVHSASLYVLSRDPDGLGPELCDVLAALTTINSHDNFNLERVETLGDSFLKFASTLYLFHKFPKLNEGQLTNIKGRLIGNRNLYYAGDRINLGGRMKVEQFAPRKDFDLPGFSIPTALRKLIEDSKIRPTFLIGMEFAQDEALSGQIKSDSWKKVQERFVDNTGVVEKETPDCIQNAMQCYLHRQAVSDKSVADCVEALVGTYLMSNGIVGATRVLEWLRVLPKEDNFEGYLHKKVNTVLSDNRATVADVDYCMNHVRDDVEKILDYKFNDPALLLEALSHPSYIRNRLTRSYERLEFLGDAVLDLLVTAHVFERHPRLRPGELTDLRSALVNNVTFASYVVKLGLHKYICSQVNPAFDSAIMNFVQHQESRNHEILEDVIYLIDEEDCQLAEYVEVPKVLSDVFEALAGAVFVDSGGSLARAWRVFERVMRRELDAFARRVPLQPARLLHEMIFACPVFGRAEIINSDVPKVMFPVTVTKNGKQYKVHGIGNNKFQAKRAAAKLALKILSV